MKGKLFGIGLGPGDPELLTIKATRIIESAPVIAYPAPEIGDSFARSIASSLITKNQLEIIIRTPMNLERFPVNEVYDKASETIKRHLNSGSDVAVLCEGDPFLYGSFSYIFFRLSSEFDINIVPGVSSVSACAAASGRPLVLKNQTLSIVPATLAISELRRLFLVSEGIAIMKVGRHLEKIRKVLQELKLEQFAYYVEYASLKGERVSPLANTVGWKAPYFSMILIGKDLDL